MVFTSVQNHQEWALYLLTAFETTQVTPESNHCARASEAMAWPLLMQANPTIEGYEDYFTWLSIINDAYS